MRIFKTRFFTKWAGKEKLNDKLLLRAIQEMEQGLIDADLGGYVYKKRIALKNQGKRGGIRTIIVYQARDKAFFVFGYAKNARENMTIEERSRARALADEVLSYTNEQLDKLVKINKLIEVYYGG